jgi:hypothetical protein
MIAPRCGPGRQSEPQQRDRQARAGLAHAAIPSRGAEMPSAVRVYGRGGDLPAGHFRSTPINRHRQTGPAVGLVPEADKTLAPRATRRGERMFALRLRLRFSNCLSASRTTHLSFTSRRTLDQSGKPKHPSHETGDHQPGDHTESLSERIDCKPRDCPKQ